MDRATAKTQLKPVNFQMYNTNGGVSGGKKFFNAQTTQKININA